MTNTIRDWLQGKYILVTGGTGFIGKAIVEKLLRTSAIKRIYLIIRAKRNENAFQRWEKTSQNAIFERLRTERPDAFSRVKVIEGNMAEKDCGLSDCDKQELRNNVAIVFHAAACVKFDDTLSNAILLNVRGTKELLDLVMTMKNIECFQFVSTAFSNCHLKVNKIEEVIYSQDYDWRALITMAENNSSTINILQKKIMAIHPNTYTFCKSLAEIVISETKGNLPVVILRPSVVLGSFIEPEPGWIDNFNGPIGICTGACLGILRVMRAEPTVYLDYVPVDYVVNGMIVTAWLATKKCTEDVDVYNCAYADYAKVTFDDLTQHIVKLNTEVPFNNNIWHPFLILSNNPFYYNFLFYLLQLLPGFVIDLILIIFGKKPILTKINKKIYIASAALHYFTSKTISFDATKYKSTHNMVPEVEKEIFYLEPLRLSLLENLLLLQKGVKKFLFKEKDEDLEKFKAKYWRFYYIHTATKIFLIAVLTWFVTTKLLNIMSNLVNIF